MAKKRFKTKLSKRQKRKNIMVFFTTFICSYFFVLFFGFSIGIFDNWTPLEIYIIGLLMSFFILSLLLFPSILAAVVLGLQMGKARRIRDDSTFVTMQNIDYYRDKLNEITPALASLLIDLDIYGQKDIVATLLRMQNKEAISIQKNGHISIKDKNTQKLDKSEKELLKLIKTGKLNNKWALSNWKQNRFREAEQLGYIKKKAVIKDKTIGIYIIISLFSLGIAMFLWALFLNLDLFDIETVLDFVYAQAYLLFIDMLIFVPFYFTFKKASYINRRDVLWERTALGNETAEKIFGLLSFIHEFSLLSEAKKEQAILWDDYLVYAIVLEENEQIVKEISKQYQIDIHSFNKLGLHLI